MYDKVRWYSSLAGMLIKMGERELKIKGYITLIFIKVRGIRKILEIEYELIC